MKQLDENQQGSRTQYTINQQDLTFIEYSIQQDQNMHSFEHPGNQNRPYPGPQNKPQQNFKLKLYSVFSLSIMESH